MQKLLRATFSAGFLLAATWLFRLDANAENVATTASSSQRLSGPYEFKNLALYLVHGADTIATGNLVTLEQALQQKQIKVYETGSVNELKVQNLSKDKTIFIQAGDIVKGGRQDRTLSSDLLLPPGRQKVSVQVFCVEHSRWSERHGESDREFHGSSNMIASKKMKVAAKFAKEQSQVWSEVEAVQDKLSTKLGKSVHSPLSESSLQLSLEDHDVEQRSSEYQTSFRALVESNPDAVGYVFAINGDLNSADIYASHALLRSLWPKLLKAAADEALSEEQPGVTSKPLELTQVQQFLNNAEHGTRRQVQSGDSVSTRENDKSYFAETKLTPTDKTWLHRTYVTK